MSHYYYYVIRLEGPENPHHSHSRFLRSRDHAHASIPLSQTPWGLTVVVVVVCICPDQPGWSLPMEETMLVRRIIFVVIFFIFSFIFFVTIFVGQTVLSSLPQF